MNITSISNLKYNTGYFTQPSFKSNPEHEAMLRALRRAQAEEMKQRFARLEELLNYDIRDKGCRNMAQFTLNFACAIENNSEHDLDEFFASEVEAAELRKRLTPECQKYSLEIREEIQSQPVFKDPALALISAKDMKDFIPDEGLLSDDQFRATINAAKKSFVNAVKVADKKKFNETEKGLIQNLTEIIERTSGIDFGKEYDQKLEQLIKSLQSRKQDAERVLSKQKVVIPKVLKKLK